jgi:uncharacterized protein YutE (UPF0331/DUF86 family)
VTPRRVEPGVVRAKLDLIDRTCDVLASLGERLKPSVGMRNVIIHEYVRLDLELVAASVPAAVDGYRTFVRSVARSLLHERPAAGPAARPRDDDGRPLDG